MFVYVQMNFVTHLHVICSILSNHFYVILTSVF